MMRPIPLTWLLWLLIASLELRTAWVAATSAEQATVPACCAFALMVVLVLVIEEQRRVRWKAADHR